MIDAFGTEIEVGDTIAYGRQKWSWVELKKATVLKIRLVQSKWSSRDSTEKAQVRVHVNPKDYEWHLHEYTTNLSMSQNIVVLKKAKTSLEDLKEKYLGKQTEDSKWGVDENGKATLSDHNGNVIGRQG